MTKNKKIALVVEGGAMRGIFAAGILDAFLKEDFNPFDLCIGVSAGANNLTSFLAGEYKRSYTIYTDYSLRDDFISWKRFVKGGHLLDLDWLWDISVKELPIDREKIVQSNSEFIVGVTEVNTGQIKYIKPTEHNLDDVLKASSCIPFFYREFIELDGEAYVDGGIADPIPVEEAINQGAEIVVVLRSRPFQYSMKNKKNQFLLNYLLKKHPNLKETLSNRHETYQNTIHFMRQHKAVKILEVNPPDHFQTKRLTKDFDTLNKDYESGYIKGSELIKQLNQLI